MPRPKQPAFQFYTGDWLKDPQLSMCGASTRGVWIDCVAAMWENGRSGKLVGTYAQLAQVCRCTATQMQKSVAELKATGTATVTERNGRVTLINRRMEKDAKARALNAERQKRHRESRPSNATVTPEKRKCHNASSSSSSTSVTPLPPKRRIEISDALENKGALSTQASFAIESATSEAELLAIYKKATGEDYADA